MKKPKAEPTEHSEQAAVIQWAALQCGKWPALRLLYAIPNGAFFGGEVKELKGGKKVPLGAIRARRLKAEGLKEGVPDLCLPVPNSKHGHGLYIEMKRQTQGRASAEQEWWLAALQAAGYHTVLCHGATAAIEALRTWLQDAPPITLPPLPAPPSSNNRKRAPRAPSATANNRKHRSAAPWRVRLPP